MSQPVPLGEQQQRELLWQLGRALTARLASGWREVRVRYQAAGRHVEVDLLVTGADSTPHPERPAPEVVDMLGMLRSGMYQPGRGTWLVAELVARPGADLPEPSYGYDQEPHWRRVPPPVGFADELNTFPRAEEHVPAWLRRRLSGPETAPTAPAARPSSNGRVHIRTPRVHDGFDKSGRAVVRRVKLSDEEKERVLGYLEGPPVLLSSKGYATDAFDPDGSPNVPLTFRTDGSWVWPGSVPHYLRTHSVTPDPDLLSHIRALDFVLPEVDEPARKAAVAAVTGGDDLLDDD